MVHMYHRRQRACMKKSAVNQVFARQGIQPKELPTAMPVWLRGENMFVQRYFLASRQNSL